MSEEYVKQHIVPKRYLDRFATSNGKGKRYIGVRVNNGKGIKLFKTTTDRIGFVNNVYNVQDKIDEKYWEHFFAKEFDHLYGNELNRIIAKIVLSHKCDNILDEYDKDVLSRLITSQILRHPKNIDYIDQVFPRLKRQTKEILLEQVPKQHKEKVSSVIDNIKFTKMQSNDVYLSGVFKKERFELFCNMLKQKTWIIYQNAITNTVPFTTSDNPVLVIDKKSSDLGVFKVGINNENAVIFYPLSPSIAVQLVDKKEWTLGFLDNCKRYLKKQDIKFLLNMSKISMENANCQAYLPLPFYNWLIESNEKRCEIN